MSIKVEFDATRDFAMPDISLAAPFAGMPGTARLLSMHVHACA